MEAYCSAETIFIKSTGPILFKQKRIGRNGKTFCFLKIRSMIMNADAKKAELMAQNRVKDGMMFKLEDDPRIIGSKILPYGRYKKGIGNFIRDWSIDELPFNVLKGGMSIVETRPHNNGRMEQVQASPQSAFCFQAWNHRTLAGKLHKPDHRL